MKKIKDCILIISICLLFFSSSFGQSKKELHTIINSQNDEIKNLKSQNETLKIYILEFKKSQALTLLKLKNELIKISFGIDEKNVELNDSKFNSQLNLQEQNC